MVMEIPEKGRPGDELGPEMEAMRGHDLDWKRGRHGAFVWYANDELEHVLREAFGMFLVENGLGVKAFPSIGRMESEVLAMVRGLLPVTKTARGSSHRAAPRASSRASRRCGNGPAESGLKYTGRRSWRHARRTRR